MQSTLLWGIFGGHSLWEYFTVILDTIPKVMYYLYACLSSVLDILQTMVRKLAGLDVYFIYQEGEKVPIRGTDPISEFIYGILGIGKNASTYSVLSTTFWSLAIFGVIVLVIATIVAIVKAHYNEDSSKTSPITYVYTALKAVFTFAIVPVAALLGITLSSFMLKTLDKITTGTGTTQEAVEYVYGKTATEKFVSASVDGNKTYGRFDYLGFGGYTNTTTFSGSMFKAAAYSCNRVRMGQYVKDSFPNPKKIFGNDGEASSAKDYGDITQKDNWQEWVAYQIDYAFENNLNVKGAIHAYECANTNNVLITISSVDMFGLVGASDGFSKFNVGLVWYFYRLWQFNFLIGFAAVIMAVGIMIGIILSLMSRLMKTVALFIIYPSILGLAPLDNFKAFGTWRTEFISQILMAFGAIIGMNLFFLVLPYINNLAFFGVGILDYIINILVIIAGLLMVQGFISFLSGLIGGADAVKTGDDLKKGVSGTLAKAGGMTLGTANIGVRAAVGLNPALLGAKAGFSKIDKKIQQKKANDLEREAISDDPIHHKKGELDENGNIYTRKSARAANKASRKEGKTRLDAAQQKVETRLSQNEEFEVYNDALSKGKSKKEARSAQRAAIEDKYYKENNLGQSDKAKEKIKSARDLRVENTLDQVTGKGAGRVKAMAKKQGEGLLQAFAKGLEGVTGALGVNTKAVTGVFRNLGNGKFDKDTGAQTGGTYSKGNVFRSAFTFSNPVDKFEKPLKPEESQAKSAQASIDAANATAASAQKIAEAAAGLKQATEELRRANSGGRRETSLDSRGSGVTDSGVSYNVANNGEKVTKSGIILP